MDIFEQFAVNTFTNLGLESRLSEVLGFFVYDSAKILILLAIMIMIVSIIRTFFPPKKIRVILKGKKGFLGNITAALFGVPTPFCSCSAVPIFIGMVESGIPLGITFSFLISSPMVNEVALAMLLSLFGWEVAVLYLVLGLSIAIFGGYAIGKLGMKKYVEKFSNKLRNEAVFWNKKFTNKERIEYGFLQIKKIVPKVTPFILFGVALGAIIHGYVPNNFFEIISGTGNEFIGLVIAILIGIPLYSNSAGIIPIVSSLISKGIPLGTALAFMMSVIGLSLPELIILRKVLKPKLLAVFVITLFLGILTAGIIFNAIF
jgi:uncharacterized membrane protein YraQ (UPF0718 family)